jgi:uncharacterized membrane protein HdeD (DUF308 family)
MKKLILGIILLIIGVLIAIFYGETDAYYAGVVILLVIGISLFLIGGIELLPDKSKNKYPN